MKLKTGVIVTKMDDQYVAVTAGEAGKAFNGMIKMNGTAAFIVEKLQNETTVDDLTAALCAEYEVGEEEARANVEKIIVALEKARILEK